MTWRYSEKGNKNRESLLKFKDIHKGKRVFIIANGPSIKHMDLSFLKNEYTICMNRFYMLFDRLDFTPNYLVCIEDLVLTQFSNDFNQLAMDGVFVNWRLNNKIASHYLKESFSVMPFFQNDLTKPTHFGGTVTFACLQLADFMGFEEIVLIGLDHSFKEKGTANKVEVRKYEEDESHFDPNYFPKGTKWRLPDLEKSEMSYLIARKNLETKGTTVVDATFEGKCKIFKKVNLSELI